MSRTFHHGERRIRVRGVRRHPVDLRRLARALIDLAQAEAEAAAKAEHKIKNPANSPARAAEKPTTAIKKSKRTPRGPEAA